MRLVTLFLVVVVSLTLTVNAQDNEQKKQPAGYSIVKIDGKTLTANNYEEFQTLVKLTQSINELKKQRSEGKLLKADMETAMNELFNDAKARGITIQ